MELAAVILSILGLGLLIFALGALMGWYWAVKSLDVKPPAWIIGVTAAAGTAMVGSRAALQDWLSALLTGLLFLLIVGAQLRAGPFRRSSGGDAT